MSQKRIVESLSVIFESHRSVFWNDIESEFLAEIDSLIPQDVKLIYVDETPAISIKIDMEREPQQCRLFYSTKPQPEKIVDWLLDIRLQGKSFKADSTSILLDDLGLVSQSLVDYLKTRAKFFRSKERTERLKRFISPTDTAQQLDCKMLAVLTRADQPELFSILLRLSASMIVEEGVDFDSLPKFWQDIVSNDLEGAFWQLAKRQFGYDENEPSVRDLLFTLLVTDFVYSLNGDAPNALQHFVLEERNLAANAAVFVSRWRSDLTFYSDYNLITNKVAQALGLENHLTGFSGDDLSEVMTFETVERRIISDLKDRILSGAGMTMDAISILIARRRDGHWANKMLASNNDNNRALSASYDALEAAIVFLQLKEKYHDGISFKNAKQGFNLYQDELFLFDQSYRHFHRAAEYVEPMGWKILHDLKQRIEDNYSGWFMPQLSMAWANVLEGESNLLATWKIAEVTNQYDFFVSHVAPLLKGNAKRVFVILSDAMRYEVAQELSDEINRKNRFKSTLSSMLGVLPSYTRLGMASLLPHKTLAYRISATNLDVMADNKPVSSMEQRHAHLAQQSGAAIKAEDLLAMGKESGREFARQHSLVYVYHDRIDLIGDKQGSETKTFEAVADTIVELSQLISFIANNNLASQIIVTADHGFLYQESALDEPDKSSIGEKPEGALHSKKRYLLGQQLGDHEKVWQGNTALTALTNADESLDFWIPKGVSRFHFSGGARFVHGGAMPQEIVIPVISIRLSESESSKTKEVSINLLGSYNRVVTNTQRFEFIQGEAISERILPRTVIISLRDGDVPISNEQTLTFDSSSNLIDERKRSVLLTVLSGNYDRNKDYYLVVRDAKTKVEILRETLKVDLSFSNDF
jgi:uncharacterized protein (TIGR02687 family)